jgi:hypothetical protein
VRTCTAAGPARDGHPVLADLRRDGIDLAGEPARDLFGTDVRSVSSHAGVRPDPGFWSKRRASPPDQCSGLPPVAPITSPLM